MGTQGNRGCAGFDAGRVTRGVALPKRLQCTTYRFILTAVGTIIAVLSGRPRIVDRTRVLAFLREIFLAVGSTRDALRKLPLLRSFNPTKRKKHSGHGEQ